MGKEHGILTSQDMEKECGIFLSQGKKKKQLAWRMKKLAEQW